MQPSKRTSARKLSADESGVSEVIGYSLTFAILSGILVLSLNGFNAAQEDVELRVLQLQADSAAQRVASAVLQGSLLVELDDVATYERRIDLDQHFANKAYVIDLAADAVYVNVTSKGISAKEPLFGAGQSITLCDTEQVVAGGPLLVRYDSTGGSCGSAALYLEDAG